MNDLLFCEKVNWNFNGLCFELRFSLPLTDGPCDLPFEKSSEQWYGIVSVQLSNWWCWTICFMLASISITVTVNFLILCNFKAKFSNENPRNKVEVITVSLDVWLCLFRSHGFWYHDHDHDHFEWASTSKITDGMHEKSGPSTTQDKNWLKKH